MKILVVEDEAASRKLASLLLSTEGHEVADAHSAELALTAISKNQPELILLDLSLPGMDGLSLARRVNENPQTRHIPIVAVTAYPERFPRAAALLAGCDAYILKPIDTRKLPAQVQSVVEKKQNLKRK